MLRDLEILRAISKVYATISFTITTADDELGKKIEPGAPLVSRRFAAMAQLAKAGLMTGVLLMPVLPFIEDNPENITAIVTRAYAITIANCSPSPRNTAWTFSVSAIRVLPPFPWIPRVIPCIAT